MAKQTSIGSLSKGLSPTDKHRKILIERATFSSGKRREVFWVTLSNRFTSHKLPAVTLEELEQIVQLAKELREAIEKGGL
jgi:hypothetical protein